MTQIKFGTDGWRAIIGAEYTVDNVKRISEGTAKWLKKNKKKSVVIGYDCRFGGEMFAETTARVMGAYGIKVLMAKDYVSTPMVSLGTVQLKADLGIVITASHNPASYNGFKLKSHYGGPTTPEDVAQVEALIPKRSTKKLPELSEMKEKGLLEYVPLEEMYIQHVENNFDLNVMRTGGVKMAYDAMFGAGKRAMQRLFPEAILLHCDDNPGFHGQAPEPIMRNLLEISTIIKNDPSINLGIANDGDADRIGMFDEDGNFVDSHHVLLLLLLYLHKYKGMSGKVVITFSVTDKMRKMAEAFNLPWVITKIGFKYIAEIMINEDVLVGGEESGGLAVKGHIPERDGIWIGLMILEFMAKTGKSLKQLIQEVYDVVGKFAFDRDDLRLKEEQKQHIITQCKARSYTAFGDYKVLSVEDTDGYKFNFGNDAWIMIRPSGTEPVLRVYAQADTLEDARKMLDATRAAIL
jgi:phosphomannomutase